MEECVIVRDKPKGRAQQPEVCTQQSGATTSGRLVNSAGNIKLTLSTGLLLLLSACARIDHLVYEPYVAEIDGLSQLEISTYPADFGRTRKHVPFVYRHMETHDKLFFQVFIRNKEQAGKNPHVESIQIHSFTYRFGDQPDTVLLTEYGDYFWMQGQPNYNKDYAETQPVLFVPDAEITVVINFTLNGTNYEFQGKMPSAREERLMPLLVYAFR